MNNMNELFNYLLKYPEFVSFIQNYSENFQITNSLEYRRVIIMNDKTNHISLEIDKEVYEKIQYFSTDITTEVKIYRRNLQISKI